MHVGGGGGGGVVTIELYTLLGNVSVSLEPCLRYRGGGFGGRGEMVPFLLIENTSYEFCAIMVTLLNDVVR